MRLPEAMHEDDDFEVLDDKWGSLFQSGNVPTRLQCEYNMEGLVELGEGVEFVEPEYYVPPPSEEEEEDGDDMEGSADGDDEFVEEE